MGCGQSVALFTHIMFAKEAQRYLTYAAVGRRMERKSVGVNLMSALGQKRTHAAQQN
jgi:hypothetical protein